MSAYVPFEIQVEIIKRVSVVKSLIRFTSVSKPWKSLIHSSEFITGHSVNHTQPHHLLLRYDLEYFGPTYAFIVDDDSFPQHKFFPVVPLTVELVTCPLMLDCSKGLVCLYEKNVITLWNPSIRKSVRIGLPYDGFAIGFGVCRETGNPKIVSITRPRPPIYSACMAEVFTLSSGAWKTISMSLPYNSMYFRDQVVIDGVIHWVATYNDGCGRGRRIISFDLTSEEFGEVDLPDCFASSTDLYISKLNESLVVLDYCIDDSGETVCNVWKMLKNGTPKSLFTKLFTVKPFEDLEEYNIIGFRKNGQPIMENRCRRDSMTQELEVYEPCLEDMKGIGIDGSDFMATSYTESLLLLNQSYSVIE